MAESCCLGECQHMHELAKPVVEKWDVFKVGWSMPGEEESDNEGQPGATWEHQSLAQV